MTERHTEIIKFTEKYLIIKKKEVKKTRINTPTHAIHLKHYFFFVVFAFFFFDLSQDKNKIFNKFNTIQESTKQTKQTNNRPTKLITFLCRLN